MIFEDYILEVQNTFKPILYSSFIKNLDLISIFKFLKMELLGAFKWRNLTDDFQIYNNKFAKFVYFKEFVDGLEILVPHFLVLF